MKRVLSLLLVLLTLLTLTGCRDKEKRQKMRRQMDLYSGATQPTLPAKLSLDDGTSVENQVVYDANGVEIRLWGIYEDQSYYYLVTSLRNASGQTMSWGTTGEGSVNGQHVYPYFNGEREVCNNGMEMAELTFYKSSLPLVKVPGPISFTLYLDSEKSGREAKIPVSLNTSAGAGEAVTPLCDSPFWSENGLSLTLVAMQETYAGWQLHLSAENSTPRSIFVEDNLIGLVVNGTLVEHSFMVLYGYVSSGEQETLTLSLDWYVLEQSGITRGTPIRSVDLHVNVQRFDLSGEKQDTVLHIDIPSVGTDSDAVRAAEPTEGVETVTEPTEGFDSATEPAEGVDVVPTEAVTEPAEDL